jgi:predicted acyl esterase
MRARFAVALALALIAAVPTKVAGAEVPDGAEWTEASFPSSDGVKLHADILRPKGLPAGAKTPVILSIGRTSTTLARSGEPARFSPMPLITRQSVRKPRRAGLSPASPRKAGFPWRSAVAHAEPESPDD